MSHTHTNRSYPGDWNQRRKRVYRRDNYICQNCGTGGGPNGNAELHAHHITPLHLGGSNHLSNLITLCARCHSTHHGHPIGSANFTQTPSRSRVPANKRIPQLGTWPVHLVLFIASLLMGAPGLPNILYIIFMLVARWVQEQIYRAK